ncbi:hypothetical protein [Sphingopyxis terrae]|uniref:hypothetical protein n=1 Tax=Sphingopyxis terrae TaxID=33052 RepID=UPI001C2CB3E5|nr:hypothetical protein [Sphingopyxis terrae]QXF10868.1 hypothetical protein HBA51_00885 [Sphingopyxis terrae subsp. terrae]
MSQATAEQFRSYLDQQRTELDDQIDRARNAALARASGFGTPLGSAAYKFCSNAARETLTDYLTRISDMIGRWHGPSLTEHDARSIVVQHLHATLDEIIRPEVVFKMGNRQQDADLAAFQPELDSMKRSLQAKLLEIGVGADREHNMPAGSVVNIVHAGSIGNLQQAGDRSRQKMNVPLSAEAIASSLKLLTAQLRDASPEILERIEEHVAAIEVQLAKPEPDTGVVQEAGRSIRTVVEGALGGAIGTIMTPGIAQALRALGAVLGLS